MLLSGATNPGCILQISSQLEDPLILQWQQGMYRASLLEITSPSGQPLHAQIKEDGGKKEKKLVKLCTRAGMTPGREVTQFNATIKKCSDPNILV